MVGINGAPTSAAKARTPAVGGKRGWQTPALSTSRIATGEAKMHTAPWLRAASQKGRRLTEGIRRDIALGLCAVGIVMAEADHQQITGADMRGNVVQPPLLAEGLAAAARHGAVVNDKARQLVAHLLREGAVRAVGSAAYSIPCASVWWSISPQPVTGLSLGA